MTTIAHACANELSNKKLEGEELVNPSL